MRITDDCLPSEMLAELFAAGVRPSEATEGFDDEDWSNHDYVCEQLRARIDAMFHSFERLGNEAHVTQSVRDNGVDLLFTAEGRRIGIQVKGNREAIEATKSPRTGESMESVLKRQAVEATRWRLDEWWIVLCFDLTKTQHAKLVQRINTELLQVHLPMKIRIFEPAQAWRLLSLANEEVEALCVLRLCHDDDILVAARREVNELSDRARAVVLGTLFAALSEPDSRIVSSGDLETIVNECDDGSSESLVAILDELSVYLKPISHEHTWSVCFSAYPGICALYFSGQAIHQLSCSDAAIFATNILTVAASANDKE